MKIDIPLSTHQKHREQRMEFAKGGQKGVTVQDRKWSHSNYTLETNF